MNRRNDVRDAMLAAVPSLRAFAVSLCGNVDRADDLVQETLLRAWANLGSFQPGTSMSAWLSRSCATCSAPNIANVDVKSRMLTVPTRNPSRRCLTRIADWRSTNSARRSDCFRRNSANHLSWSAHLAFPTKRPRKFADVQSGLSKAG